MTNLTKNTSNVLASITYAANMCGVRAYAHGDIAKSLSDPNYRMSSEYQIDVVLSHDGQFEIHNFYKHLSERITINREIASSSDLYHVVTYPYLLLFDIVENFDPQFNNISIFNVDSLFLELGQNIEYTNIYTKEPIYLEHLSPPDSWSLKDILGFAFQHGKFKDVILDDNQMVALQSVQMSQCEVPVGEPLSNFLIELLVSKWPGNAIKFILNTFSDGRKWLTKQFIDLVKHLEIPIDEDLDIDSFLSVKKLELLNVYSEFFIFDRKTPETSDDRQHRLLTFMKLLFDSPTLSIKTPYIDRVSVLTSAQDPLDPGTKTITTFSDTEVTITCGELDTTYSEAIGGSPPYTPQEDNLLRMGQQGGNLYQTAIRFTGLPTIPAGNIVKSIVLNIYVVGRSSTNLLLWPLGRTPAPFPLLDNPPDFTSIGTTYTNYPESGVGEDSLFDYMHPSASNAGLIYGPVPGWVQIELQLSEQQKTAFTDSGNDSFGYVFSGVDAIFRSGRYAGFEPYIVVTYGENPGSGSGDPNWACCQADGTCVETTEEICDRLRGTWHNGETCSEVQCLPEIPGDCLYPPCPECNPETCGTPENGGEPCCCCSSVDIVSIAQVQCHKQIIISCNADGTGPGPDEDGRQQDWGSCTACSGICDMVLHGHEDPFDDITDICHGQLPDPWYLIPPTPCFCECATPSVGGDGCDLTCLMCKDEHAFCKSIVSVNGDDCAYSFQIEPSRECCGAPAGFDVVFCIDDSGSMQTEIGDVISGIESFVDAGVDRGIVSRLGLVTFRSDLELFGWNEDGTASTNNYRADPHGFGATELPGPLQYTTDVSEFKKKLQETYDDTSDGIYSTEWCTFCEWGYNAIQYALDYEMPGAFGNVIIVVSDEPWQGPYAGDGYQSGVDRRAVDELIDQCIAYNYKIFYIGILDSRTRLATETGGQYYSISDNGPDWDVVFEDVASAAGIFPSSCGCMDFEPLPIIRSVGDPLDPQNYYPQCDCPDPSECRQGTDGELPPECYEIPIAKCVDPQTESDCQGICDLPFDINMCGTTVTVTPTETNLTCCGSMEIGCTCDTPAGECPPRDCCGPQCPNEDICDDLADPFPKPLYNTLLEAQQDVWSHCEALHDVSQPCGDGCLSLRSGICSDPPDPSVDYWHPIKSVIDDLVRQEWEACGGGGGACCDGLDCTMVETEEDCAYKYMGDGSSCEPVNPCTLEPSVTWQCETTDCESEDSCIVGNPDDSKPLQDQCSRKGSEEGEDCVSVGNPSVVVLNNGIGIVAYETTLNDISVIKLQQFHTSVSNKIMANRRFGYGRLQNNRFWSSTSTSNTLKATLWVYDPLPEDILQGSDSADPGDPTTWRDVVAFSSGPLAGGCFPLFGSKPVEWDEDKRGWALHFHVPTGISLTHSFNSSDDQYDVRWFLYDQQSQSSDRTNLIGSSVTEGEQVYPNDNYLFSNPGKVDNILVSDRITDHVYNGERVPTSNPKISTAYNYSHEYENSHYLYMTYQALEDGKWNVYLRQIRLSEYDRDSQIDAASSDSQKMISVANLPDDDVPGLGISNVVYRIVCTGDKCTDVGDGEFLLQRIVAMEVLLEDGRDVFNPNYSAGSGEWPSLCPGVSADKFPREKAFVQFTHSVIADRCPDQFEFDDIFQNWSTGETFVVPITINSAQQLFSYLKTSGDNNVDVGQFDPPEEVGVVKVVSSSVGAIWYEAFDSDNNNWSAIDGDLTDSSSPFGILSRFKGFDISEPILISESERGHCTNPVICVDYDNEVFISYEYTDPDVHQVKLVGTKEPKDELPTGVVDAKNPDDSLNYFLQSNDFIYSANITESGSGVNQLPDIYVDLNNVIHVTWQSNRDKVWEIYYANSTNGFMHKRITKYDGRSLSPKITGNAHGNIFITWHDDRFGNSEIMMAYNAGIRKTPLYQQDPYLASLRNFQDGWQHTTDVIPLLVENDTSAPVCYTNMDVNFYEDRNLDNLAFTVSSRDYPFAFSLPGSESDATTESLNDQDTDWVITSAYDVAGSTIVLENFVAISNEIDSFLEDSSIKNVTLPTLNVSGGCSFGYIYFRASNIPDDPDADSQWTTAYSISGKEGETLTLEDIGITETIQGRYKQIKLAWSCEVYTNTYEIEESESDADVENDSIWSNSNTTLRFGYDDTTSAVWGSVEINEELLPSSDPTFLDVADINGTLAAIWIDDNGDLTYGELTGTGSNRSWSNKDIVLTGADLVSNVSMLEIDGFAGISYQIMTGTAPSTIQEIRYASKVSGSWQSTTVKSVPASSNAVTFGPYMINHSGNPGLFYAESVDGAIGVRYFTIYYNYSLDRGLSWPNEETVASDAGNDSLSSNFELSAAMINNAPAITYKTIYTSGRLYKARTGGSWQSPIVMKIGFATPSADYCSLVEHNNKALFIYNNGDLGTWWSQYDSSILSWSGNQSIETLSQKGQKDLYVVNSKPSFGYVELDSTSPNVYTIKSATLDSLATNSWSVESVKEDVTAPGVGSDIVNVAGCEWDDRGVIFTHSSSASVHVEGLDISEIKIYDSYLRYGIDIPRNVSIVSSHMNLTPTTNSLAASSIIRLIDDYNVNEFDDNYELDILVQNTDDDADLQNGEIWSTVSTSHGIRFGSDTTNSQWLKSAEFTSDSIQSGRDKVVMSHNESNDYISVAWVTDYNALRYAEYDGDNWSEPETVDGNITTGLAGIDMAYTNDHGMVITYVKPTSGCWIARRISEGDWLTHNIVSDHSTSYTVPILKPTSGVLGGRLSVFAQHPSESTGTGTIYVAIDFSSNWDAVLGTGTSPLLPGARIAAINGQVGVMFYQGASSLVGYAEYSAIDNAWTTSTVSGYNAIFGSLIEYNDRPLMVYESSESGVSVIWTTPTTTRPYVAWENDKVDPSGDNVLGRPGVTVVGDIIHVAYTIGETQGSLTATLREATSTDDGSTWSITTITSPYIVPSNANPSILIQYNGDGEGDDLLQLSGLKLLFGDDKSVYYRTSKIYDAYLRFPISIDPGAKIIESYLKLEPAETDDHSMGDYANAEIHLVNGDYSFAESNTYQVSASSDGDADLEVNEGRWNRSGDVVRFGSHNDDDYDAYLRFYMTLPEYAIVTSAKIIMEPTETVAPDSDILIKLLNYGSIPSLPDTITHQFPIESGADDADLQMTVNRWDNADNSVLFGNDGSDDYSAYLRFNIDIDPDGLYLQCRIKLTPAEDSACDTLTKIKLIQPNYSDIETPEFSTYQSQTFSMSGHDDDASVQIFSDDYYGDQPKKWENADNYVQWGTDTVSAGTELWESYLRFNLFNASGTGMRQGMPVNYAHIEATAFGSSPASTTYIHGIDRNVRQTTDYSSGYPQWDEVLVSIPTSASDADLQDDTQWDNDDDHVLFGLSSSYAYDAYLRFPLEEGGGNYVPYRAWVFHSYLNVTAYGSTGNDEVSKIKLINSSDVSEFIESGSQVIYCQIPNGTHPYSDGRSDDAYYQNGSEWHNRDFEIKVGSDNFDYYDAYLRFQMSSIPSGSSISSAILSVYAYSSDVGESDLTVSLINESSCILFANTEEKTVSRDNAADVAADSTLDNVPQVGNLSTPKGTISGVGEPSTVWEYGNATYGNKGVWSSYIVGDQSELGDEPEYPFDNSSLTTDLRTDGQRIGGALEISGGVLVAWVGGFVGSDDLNYNLWVSEYSDVSKSWTNPQRIDSDVVGEISLKMIGNDPCILYKRLDAGVSQVCFARKSAGWPSHSTVVTLEAYSGALFDLSHDVGGLHLIDIDPSGAGQPAVVFTRGGIADESTNSIYYAYVLSGDGTSISNWVIEETGISSYGGSEHVTRNCNKLALVDDEVYLMYTRYTSATSRDEMYFAVLGSSWDDRGRFKDISGSDNDYDSGGFDFLEYDDLQSDHARSLVVVYQGDSDQIRYALSSDGGFNWSVSDIYTVAGGHQNSTDLGGLVTYENDIVYFTVTDRWKSGSSYYLRSWRTSVNLHDSPSVLDFTGENVTEDIGSTVFDSAPLSEVQGRPCTVLLQPDASPSVPWGGAPVVYWYADVNVDAYCRFFIEDRFSSGVDHISYEAPDYFRSLNTLVFLEAYLTIDPSSGSESDATVRMINDYNVDSFFDLESDESPETALLSATSDFDPTNWVGLKGIDVRSLMQNYFDTRGGQMDNRYIGFKFDPDDDTIDVQSTFNSAPILYYKYTAPGPRDKDDGVESVMWHIGETDWIAASQQSIDVTSLIDYWWDTHTPYQYLGLVIEDANSSVNSVKSFYSTWFARYQNDIVLDPSYLTQVAQLEVVYTPPINLPLWTGHDVDWSPSTWNDTDNIQTPDISTLIQKYVSMYAPTIGHVGLKIEHVSGSSAKSFYSYDDAVQDEPELYVGFSPYIDISAYTTDKVVTWNTTSWTDSSSYTSPDLQDMVNQFVSNYNLQSNAWIGFRVETSDPFTKAITAYPFGASLYVEYSPEGERQYLSGHNGVTWDDDSDWDTGGSGPADPVYTPNILELLHEYLTDDGYFRYHYDPLYGKSYYLDENHSTINPDVASGTFKKSIGFGIVEDNSNSGCLREFHSYDGSSIPACLEIDETEIGPIVPYMIDSMTEHSGVPWSASGWDSSFTYLFNVDDNYPPYSTSWHKRFNEASTSPEGSTWHKDIGEMFFYDIGGLNVGNDSEPTYLGTGYTIEKIRPVSGEPYCDIWRISDYVNNSVYVVESTSWDVLGATTICYRVDTVETSDIAELIQIYLGLGDYDSSGSYIGLTFKNNSSSNPLKSFYANDHSRSVGPILEVEWTTSGAPPVTGTSSVDWDDVDFWTQGLEETSPDISSLVQSYIDSPTYTGSGHIGLSIKDAGSEGVREFYSRDQYNVTPSNQPAILHLKYTGAPRSKSGSVAWDASSNPALGAWTIGSSVNTPEISQLVQRYVDKSEYDPAEGHYIGFSIDDNGSSSLKQFASFETYGGLDVAELHVSWRNNYTWEFQVDSLSPARLCLAPGESASGTLDLTPQIHVDGIGNRKVESPLPIDYISNWTYFTAIEATDEDGTKVILDQKTSASCLECASSEDSWDYSACSITINMPNTSDSIKRVNIAIRIYSDPEKQDLVSQLSTFAWGNIKQFTMKQNLPAEDYMEDGQFVIAPDSTLEMLAWPVVDPRLGLVCGLTYYYDILYNEDGGAIPDKILSSSQKWICDCESSRWNDRFETSPTNLLSLNRWHSSGEGLSDTRLTETLHDNYNPSVKIRSDFNGVVLYESNRDGEWNIYASVFAYHPSYRMYASATENITSPFGEVIHRSDIPVKNAEGDHISGHGAVLDFDQYSNLFMASNDPHSNALNECSMFERYKMQSILIHRCGLDNLDFSSYENVELDKDCPADDITRQGYVSLDPVFNSIIRLLRVNNDIVQYHVTRVNLSMPVVSECEITIDVIGAPEAVAIRLRNESSGDWSDWAPFDPEEGSETMTIKHVLSSGSGVKRVQAQVATSAGVTASATLVVVGDYSRIPHSVSFYKPLGDCENGTPCPPHALEDADWLGNPDIWQENNKLTTIDNTPVASVRKPEVNEDDSEEVVIRETEYIFVEITPDNDYMDKFSDEELLSNSPTFDFIQQGGGDEFNVPTTYSSESKSFRGFIKISKEDEGAFKDGLAYIIPHFKNDCSDSTSTGTLSQEEIGKFTKDEFNAVVPGVPTVSGDTDDVWLSERGDLGLINYPITLRPTEDPYFVFGDPNYRFHKND